MTNNLTRLFFSLCFLVMLLFSCSKASTDNSNPSDLCNKLASLKVHPFTAVNKGDDIQIGIDSLANAYYHWSGPGNFESDNQNPSVSSYADYSHRGWYYVQVSLDQCSTKVDSVYVDVKFPQGTPSCSLVNNKANFGGSVALADQSFYSLSFGAGISGYEIVGNSSNGDLRITMSNYWVTNAFEDGIYYTTNDPLPEYSDIDKVFLSNVNQSIFSLCW